LCDGGLDNVWQALFATIFVLLATIFIICLKSSRAHCAAPPFRKSLVGLLRCLLLHACPPLEKFRGRIFLCDGGLDDVWQALFAAIFVLLATIFICLKSSRAHCAAPPFRKSLVGLLRCLLLHACPPLEKFRGRIFLCDGGSDKVREIAILCRKLRIAFDDFY